MKTKQKNKSFPSTFFFKLDIPYFNEDIIRESWIATSGEELEFNYEVPLL